MKFQYKRALFVSALASIAFAVGCTPDEASGGNPISASDIDATFTVTPTDASGNRYSISASTDGVIKNRWDFGTGNGEGEGKFVEELFLPDAGTYTVTHKAFGVGGAFNTSTQTITVDTPDPVAGNLILNGKFEDGSDNWTVINISASGASWTFENGEAIVSASDWNQKAISQAVQVTGGANYKLDMKVSGTGSTDTWFEVYVSTTAPVQGSEYNPAAGSGPVRFALNTWAGCATGTYSGLISQVGCGDHTGNPISFPNDGTVYVTIKCGGGNTGAIHVDNVEFRRVN